jgi:hypothetical protein
MSSEMLGVGIRLEARGERREAEVSSASIAESSGPRSMVSEMVDDKKQSITSKVAWQ